MLVLDDAYLNNYAKGTNALPGLSLGQDFLADPSAERVADISEHILGRGELNCTMVEAVIHLVRHMSPLDWILFLSDTRYREHKFHQLRVAMVAMWLFDQVFQREQTLQGLRRGTVVAALWSAAVLHDHGYALSRLARLRPALAAEPADTFTQFGREMLANLRACYEGLFATSLTECFCVPCSASTTAGTSTQELDDLVRATIRQYLGAGAVGLCRRVVDRLRSGYLYDHGLWSAANLSATLCEFGMPWDDAPQPELDAIRIAAHAMAIHNRKDFRRRDFDIARNPVAGLLVLADELQEWDRRVLPDPEDPAGIWCQVSVAFDRSDRIDICFTYSKKDLVAIKSSREEMRVWKAAVIEDRINGARGLPKAHVVVEESDGAEQEGSAMRLGG